MTYLLENKSDMKGGLYLEVPIQDFGLQSFYLIFQIIKRKKDNIMKDNGYLES